MQCVMHFHTDKPAFRLFAFSRFGSLAHNVNQSLMASRPAGQSACSADMSLNQSARCAPLHIQGNCHGAVRHSDGMCLSIYVCNHVSSLRVYAEYRHGVGDLVYMLNWLRQISEKGK